MSHHARTAIPGLAALALTLAAVTACQRDDPVSPRHDDRGTAATQPSLVKLKPVFYFNGIMFQGTHDEAHGEIYSMNPDGTGVYRITNDTIIDEAPDVDPVNSRFAWVRHPTNTLMSELFVENFDGTHRKQLTSLNSQILNPRFSADGSKIAFASVVGGGNYDIYTINADGTGLAKLTTDPASDMFPTWSPDGSKIAFQTNRSGTPAVWVMDASGSNQTSLVTCPAPGCGTPEWNPIYDLIVVAHIDGTGIFTINATTGGQNGWIPWVGGSDRQPTWGKDGKLIVWASTRAGGGSYDIFSSEVTRSTTQVPMLPYRLTSFTPGDEQLPAYSR